MEKDPDNFQSCMQLVFQQALVSSDRALPYTANREATETQRFCRVYL